MTTEIREGNPTDDEASASSASDDTGQSVHTSPTDDVDRVTVDDLGDVADGLVHISVHVGFTDSQDVPKGLALAIGKTHELNIDPDNVHYFLSVLTVHATGPRGLRSWRKRLYVWLHHNAANRTEVFHLPPDRTVIMGAPFTAGCR